MSLELLRNEALSKIDKLGHVDIVIGIPSYNNAETIGGVVETFGGGLRRYFPELKALLVNSDGGSKDDTCGAFYGAQIPPGIERIATEYRGPSGKGSALRTVFEIGSHLNARVCVVTDADCRTNDPQWVEQLVRPIHGGMAGFVTPLYIRDKHDATITNGLIYPFTQALYGKDIRQPIGGDFAIAGGLLPVFTNEWHWQRFPDIATFGIDIWMTTVSVNEGVQICQTSLGHKVHQAKEPGKDLLAMFRQVVGTTFELTDHYAAKWQGIHRSQSVPTYGEEPFGEIEDVAVNDTAMLDRFYEGYRLFRSDWEEVLSRHAFEELRRVREQHFSSFTFPVDLWAKVVYEFAAYYCLACTTREKKNAVLEAMIPLYLARTASYVRELIIISDELADAFVRGCAHVFVRLKPYLLRRWQHLNGLRDRADTRRAKTSG
jgi:glycosyltransferase involved in cell wall biosynthesis